MNTYLTENSPVVTKYGVTVPVTDVTGAKNVRQTNKPGSYFGV